MKKDPSFVSLNSLSHHAHTARQSDNNDRQVVEELDLSSHKKTFIASPYSPNVSSFEGKRVKSKKSVKQSLNNLLKSPAERPQ